MKRFILGAALFVSACEGGAGLGGLGLGGGGSGGGGPREFMVIGNRMSFEDCRSRGGLIIRDSNTSMIACDPTVRGEPQPVDEFNNPSARPAS